MSDMRVGVLLALAAFLARYTLYLGTAIFGTDSAQFLLMAEWMGQARFHDALAVTYHPLYPLLTAAAGVFVGDLERAGFWVSMLLGSAATVPLFLLARAVFGRRTAIVTALLYALQPHTVEVQADVMTEGAFAFFFISAMWLCWRTMEEPSIERSIVMGMAAVAAYLTRPEGILAVVLVIAWPVFAAIRRKEARRARLAGVGLSAVVILILAFPFLVWVHSVMGAWKLSAKITVKAAGSTFQESDESSGPSKPERDTASRRLAHAGGAMVKMTYYLLIPFMLLGVWGLRGGPAKAAIFYFSFPLGYLAGVAASIRGIPAFSYRYVLLPMNLLMALAGVGIVMAMGWVQRRWPNRRWALAPFALILLFALPSLRPHRTEEGSYRAVAEDLRARKIAPATVYCTTDKLNYLLHGMTKGYPMRLDQFQAEIAKAPGAAYIVQEKDLKGRVNPYLEWLKSSGHLAGEPSIKGSLRVYPGR